MNEALLGPVRISNLRYMGKSPAHYRDNILHPVAQSPGMRLGALVHAMALGGDWVVFEGRRAGKRWDDFRAEHGHRLIVSETEENDALRVVHAIRRHPEAVRLLVGEREVEIAWEISGRACMSHVDVVGPGRVCELKTTRDARPGHFARDCRAFGYHAQLAYYVDACLYSGRRIDAAYVVAVETKRPYVVSTFELGPRAIEEGRRTYRAWFERLRACEDADDWPGYCEATTNLDDELGAEPELIFGDEETTDED